MTPLLFSLVLAAGAPTDTLSYTVTFVRGPVPSLRVELVFRG